MDEQAPLRIDLRRSGGFAGLREGASVDKSELAPEEAREVEEALARVDLSELAGRSPIRGRGADRYQYDLTVARGDEEAHVTIQEGELPSELRPLIDVVMRRATPRGR